MSKFFVITSLLLAACTGGAAAHWAQSSHATKRRRELTGCARISGRRKIAHSPARSSCRLKTPRGSNSNSAEVRTASGTG